MSTPQVKIGDAVNYVIKNGIGKALKNEGFKKWGKNFQLNAASSIQGVNIQSDKWNQGSTGGFFINMGIYYPQIEGSPYPTMEKRSAMVSDLWHIWERLDYRP